MALIRLYLRRSAVLFFVCFIAATAAAQSFSPYQYGLGDAADPTEVYRVLLRTHKAADSCGGSVSYKGIDTLRIEIPSDGESIPLQADNDFGGLVLMVTNKAKGLFLFSHTPSAHVIPVDDTLALCRAIDSGDFRTIPILQEGDWLLHIVDSTPWVDQRKGYKYGHYREDILRIHDGFSADRPTMPYDDGESRPYIFARRLDSASLTPLTFSNITFLRDSASTCATYLLKLENLPTATLRNIVVVTPHSGVLAINDAIIRVYNSTNVKMDSISLWGTYSRANHSGYGLLLGNLRDTHVRRLKSVSEWGIFGTNNMINTYIEYSDFNRFDIHCYGRDVTFDHCLQMNGYNQFSSVYGTIAFRSCTFSNFTPVLIEDSYNAPTHFVLSMDSCHWWPTTRHHSLFKGGSIDGRLNSRKKLQVPALPDFDIHQLEIHTNKGIRKVELLLLSGKERRAHLFGGLGHLVLRGVTISGNADTKIVLSNKRVRLLGEAVIETPSGRLGTTFISDVGIGL